MSDFATQPVDGASLHIHGVRNVLGPRESTQGAIEITHGRLTAIASDRIAGSKTLGEIQTIVLDGFLVMPGLINAHDHLHLALLPNLGRPPYSNYIEWGNDIHTKDASCIAHNKAISKRIRLLWGGLRNLLCGVTTVCHHDHFWPELGMEEFPVRVVQKYGWAHSLALGGDLKKAWSNSPSGAAFIVHACEGVDSIAEGEIFELDHLGVLGPTTVLVHGLALNHEGVELLQKQQASLIICPTSNRFLFHTTPKIELVQTIKDLALGSDSPVTSAGDLLDEIRFAIETCGFSPERVYRMVTSSPASILHLGHEAALRIGSPGDLIAVRDTGADAAERMCTLSISDIELVVIGGRIQLASHEVAKRIPAELKWGLERICVDGCERWVRVPIKELFQQTVAGGHSEIFLGKHKIDTPATAVFSGNGGRFHEQASGSSS